MVGSSFILVNKNGRRLLFNTAQIIGIKDIDVLLTEFTRRHYWQLPAESQMVYLVRIEQPDGFTDLMFTEAAERDELLDKFVAAISPSAVLDSAPGLPRPWSELERMGPPPSTRYKLDGKQYATKEEYDRARAEEAEREHQEIMAIVMAEYPSQTATTPPAVPPAAKPPRKPYTRKPRE